MQCSKACLLWAKSGHSCSRQTERDRQPRPNRSIKLLTASDCDLTATRAAGLDLSKRTNWQGSLPSRIPSVQFARRTCSGRPILHDPHGNVWTSRAFKGAPVVTRLVTLDTCKPHL